MVRSSGKCPLNAISPQEDRMPKCAKRPLGVGLMLPTFEGTMAGETPRWNDLRAMACHAEAVGFGFVMGGRPHAPRLRRAGCYPAWRVGWFGGPRVPSERHDAHRTWNVRRVHGLPQS